VEKISDHYGKAVDAIREVYRKGDSEELLALRYIAHTLAEDKTVEELELASQQADTADPGHPRDLCSCNEDEETCQIHGSDPY